jgi:hypothetical protein
MSKLALLLGHFWALPLTVLGILAAYLGGAKFHCLGPLGTLVFVVRAAGRGLCWRFFGTFSMAAYTWGACITLGSTRLIRDAAFVRHECEHVKQAMHWGAFFPVAYILAGLDALCIGRSFYADNYFERAARAAEEKVEPSHA